MSYKPEVQTDDTGKGYSEVLREVTRETFFEVMNPLNVHPYARHPEYSEWETPDRRLIGVSYPGWKNPGGEKKYLLRDKL